MNIGSASVFDGVADQPPYVSAKAGLLGLTRSLARAFGGEEITVNVVTPGLTATPRVLRNLPAEMLKDQIKVRALPRQEEAGDLVGALFFLASPDADFISGQTVNVDGGSHMVQRFIDEEEGHGPSRWESRVPLKRVGPSEEIASAVNRTHRGKERTS